MEITLKELFGVNSQQTEWVNDRAPTFGATPIPSYLFRKELVRDIIIFNRLPNSYRAAMLSGHKGSGKTSIVEQMHLRLNKDLKVMTGNGKTTLEALFGQYIINEAGKLVWQDGPVTWAARTGGSVLINEFNAIPEDLQLSLMDVAHVGEPLSLPEKGEQFMPHPEFRMYCTINPRGGNEFIYRGRKDMDAALKERFFWIYVDYGTREEEEEILLRTWVDVVGLDKEIAKKYIKQQLDVADAIRTLANATNASAIPEIISTRVLVNWVVLWGQYRSSVSSVHMGLQRALTFGCSPEVQFQIHQIVAAHTSVPSPYGLVS